MDSRQVNAGHLDTLTEIGTMGAGRAATALAEILNTKVDITVPEAKLVSSKDFISSMAKPGESYFVLVIVLEGELGGRVFFLMSSHEARTLGASLLGVPQEDINFADPLFQSSLKEALNIIVGAYMSALSELTGFEIMFSVPYLALDLLTAVFIADNTPQKSDEVILIKTALRISEANFDGAFLFYPDLPSIKKIFKALGQEMN